MNEKTSPTLRVFFDFLIMSRISSKRLSFSDLTTRFSSSDSESSTIYKNGYYLDNGNDVKQTV